MPDSLYLLFTLDKLAYMLGEQGPDPVNSPDEVYRRYGSESEPHDVLSSMGMPLTQYSMPLSPRLDIDEANAINSSVVGGFALALPATLAAGPVGGLLATPVGAKLGQTFLTPDAESKDSALYGKTPYTMMGAGAGGALLGAWLARKKADSLGLTPEHASVLGGTAGLIGGAAGGYLLGRFLND